MKIWTCKVGFVNRIPPGADLPMRLAVANAYRNVTGVAPSFQFSGWDDSLTEAERAVVEDRLPSTRLILRELDAEITRLMTYRESVRRTGNL